MKPPPRRQQPGPESLRRRRGTERQWLHRQRQFSEFSAHQVVRVAFENFGLLADAENYQPVGCQIFFATR